MKLHERPQQGGRDAGRGGQQRDGQGGGRRDQGNRDQGRRQPMAPRRPEPEPVNPLAAQLAKLDLRRN